MSNISNNRLEEVIKYYNNSGEQSTVEKFEISGETLHRYIREYNLRKRGVDTNKNNKHELPNVLIYDIEVAPMPAWIYQAFTRYVRDDQLVNPWFILTWSAKWLMDDKVYSDRLTTEEAKIRDDKRVVTSLWELINDADIIIAHNGKKYDVPKMNTKFLLHNLPRPLPYQIIDTLEVARKQFSFVYNKLDYICKVLGLGGKLEHSGMPLWISATQGDDDALREMETYNRRDTTLLEEAYLKIRSWIPSHPNLSLYVDTDEPICQVCLADETNFEWGGYYTTMVGRYNTFRCKNCGSIGRVRKTGLSKEKNKNTVVSIAR